MKLTMKNIGGKIAKQDDRYMVVDNAFGNNLVLSSTRLYGLEETNGHSHKGQEEVYFFVQGRGKMQLDDDTFSVKAGDVIPIQDGVFHKVFNTSKKDLYFVCVFDGTRTK